MLMEKGQEYTSTPFEWSQDVQDLMSGMGTRGKEFLGMKPGLSDVAQRAMFGQNFETLRDVGARQPEMMRDYMASEGLAGTGAAQDIYRDLAWQTESGIGNIMQDLFLADEAQKREDRYGYTQAAQSILNELAGLGAQQEGLTTDRINLGQNIFGTGMTFQTLLEQINAGRRGEGQNALNLLLQYLMGLMGSWG